MSIKDGVRYALDEHTTIQYAIKFKDGAPVDFEIIATNDPAAQKRIHEIMSTGRFTAIDDESLIGYNNNTGETEARRPVYTIEFAATPSGSKAIKNVKIDNQDTQTPLPPQHRSGLADFARDYASQGMLFRNRRNFPQQRPTQSGPSPIEEALKRLFDGMGNPGMPGQNFPEKRPANDRNLKSTQVKDGVHKPGMRQQGPGVRFTVRDGDVENNMIKYGKDLTQLAYEGRLDPVVGRDKEIEDIAQLLLRKKRSNVMILGEAGVGKTALADGLARLIASGKAPAELADARVVSLNLQSMTAGTQFRGSFEERLEPILKGLDERGGYLKGQKIILFIDELHSALKAGGAQGAKGAGEILKPYISGGSLSVIGATTLDEYKEHIEKDKAIVRRFQPYEIKEPKTEHTLEIIEGVAKAYEDYHGLENPFDMQTLEYAVRMSDRFMPNHQQPDKALGIMDDAAAIARIDGRKEVTEADIRRAVSKATKLDEEFLSQGDLERYLNLEDRLESDVKGQPVVKEIAEILRSSRMGLTDENAPRGSFLFTGPTGVGKTELAKSLNKHLNGGGELVRINMSEYMEKHAAAKLIGAPPGYVGFDNASSAQLTDAVRSQPFSVILIDEIEKAHPDVMDIFLSVLDDGELKDGQGRMIDFRNTILVFTSNLGAQSVQAYLSGNNHGYSFKTSLDGDDNKAKEVDHQKIKAITMAALQNRDEGGLRPEMINRFDGIHTFYPLEKDSIRDILNLRLVEVEQNLRESPHGLQLNNVKLEIADEVKDLLAEKGYDKAFGARPLKRAIKTHLTNDLGRWMMQNREKITDLNAKGAFKVVVDRVGKDFAPQLVALETKKPAKEEDKVGVAAQKPADAQPVSKANDNDQAPKATVKKPNPPKIG